MNKKLLTAAVLSTLAAAPVSSYAAAEFYGLVDVAIQQVDPGTGYAGSKTFLTDTGSSGGSNLGFRVAEDLGGGMKGLAVAEIGMFSDTGALDNAGASNVTYNPTLTATATASGTSASSKLFQRQIYAGLSGGFGTITAGRQYTEDFLTQGLGAYASTAAAIGVNMLVTAAPTSTAIAGVPAGAAKTPQAVGTRQDNYVKYVTPDFAGVKVALGYGLGEGTTAAAEDNHVMEVSLKYIAGPIKVGLSQSTTKVGTLESTDRTFAGQFSFGPATLYAQYRTFEDDAAGAEKDMDLQSVGAKFTVGSGDIVLEYAKLNENITDRAATLLGVGYYHSLSKTTTVYAAYGTVDNDTGGTVIVPRQPVANTNATVGGEKVNTIVIGTKVAF